MAETDQMDEREYPDFDSADFSGGLRGCIEAILMSSDDPLTGEDLARVLACPVPQIKECFTQLRQEYTQQGRGFELVESVRGWRFMSRAEYEPVVAAFVADRRTNRLSQAALESLAIIAYKQPLTRGQVSSIRGVASEGVIRSLMLRGLVVELGEEAETHARLLATTDLFLEKIGVKSLEDLPPLAPFLPAPQDAMDDGEGGSLGGENSERSAKDSIEEDGVVGRAVPGEGASAFNRFIDRL